MLSMAACGSAAPFADSNNARVEVPKGLRAAYLEAGRARFALAACRAPEQRQAIAALDSERERVEETLASRYAPPTLVELKSASDREFLVAQIEQCAGALGIDRFRASVDALGRIARAAS
jgi:hypothetical protein